MTLWQLTDVINRYTRLKLEYKTYGYNGRAKVLLKDKIIYDGFTAQVRTFLEGFFSAIKLICQNSMCRHKDLPYKYSYCNYKKDCIVKDAFKLQEER
jgi:hypothetical protein